MGSRWCLAAWSSISRRAVSGASSGVYITNGLGRVTNNGIITGSSAASVGVNFAAGGSVTNLAREPSAASLMAC